MRQAKCYLCSCFIHRDDEAVLVRINGVRGLKRAHVNCVSNKALCDGLTVTVKAKIIHSNNRWVAI